MKYDKEQIRDLCNHFDLLGYVEQTYETKKRGSEYAIHCPKHKDDTPSLFITTENSFYCHSCHRGGGPIDWFIKMEDLSFLDAVKKMQSLTGIELKQIETSTSLKFFQSLSDITNKQTKDIAREIFDDSLLDKYQVVDGEPHEWIEEGIDRSMIRKYNIRIDDRSNRIVYPVYDNDDNLIGVKGRTRYDNYKILGLKKYQNYNKIGTTNYFQGMHENRDNILRTGEVIIFEGLKSVMKCDEWGRPNAISAETSVINQQQAEILIKMGVRNCVIAFDKGVPSDEIKQSTDRLKRWMNVWIVEDKKGLLADKDAPVDKGKEIWETLYECRRKVV